MCVCVYVCLCVCVCVCLYVCVSVYSFGPPLTISIPVMRRLWATVYRHQNVRKWVREFMYGCTNVHEKSILVGLWFWLKQLQTWSKKFLKIGVWQFASCVNGTLNLRNVAGEFYDKGIQKNAIAHAKVIPSKNSWKSLSINVTFIANKRVFYVKKLGDLILRTHFIQHEK